MADQRSAVGGALEVETPALIAERRLVSVLFADLVGFTPLSEARDPEEVRELLSRYFDSCRRLVEEACVLGKTFSKRALAALTRRGEAELEPLLAALVRKEVLSLQADLRWPDRGQYGFLQELLREVAYDTLSRRDRKTRHLAAVSALEETFKGAELLAATLAQLGRIQMLRTELGPATATLERALELAEAYGFEETRVQALISKASGGSKVASCRTGKQTWNAHRI